MACSRRVSSPAHLLWVFFLWKTSYNFGSRVSILARSHSRTFLIFSFVLILSRFASHALYFISFGIFISNPMASETFLLLSGFVFIPPRIKVNVLIMSRHNASFYESFPQQINFVNCWIIKFLDFIRRLAKNFARKIYRWKVAEQIIITFSPSSVHISSSCLFKHRHFGGRSGGWKASTKWKPAIFAIHHFSFKQTKS